MSRELGRFIRSAAAGSIIIAGGVLVGCSDSEKIITEPSVEQSTNQEDFNIELLLSVYGQISQLSESEGKPYLVDNDGNLWTVYPNDLTLFVARDTNAFWDNEAGRINFRDENGQVNNLASDKNMTRYSIESVNGEVKVVSRYLGTEDSKTKEQVTLSPVETQELYNTLRELTKTRIYPVPTTTPTN